MGQVNLKYRKPAAPRPKQLLISLAVSASMAVAGTTYAIEANRNNTRLMGQLNDVIQQNVELKSNQENLLNEFNNMKEQNQKLTELLNQETQLFNDHMQQQQSRGSASRGDVERQSYIATGYTLSFADCGKAKGSSGYGITQGNTRATQYRTIAVDKNYIPLGSIVYITFPEQYSFLDGYFLAEDTGSGVKGRHIDIFFGEDTSSSNEFAKMAKQFGVRNIEVQVIEKGSGKVDQRHLTETNNGAGRFDPYGEIKNPPDFSEEEFQKNASIRSQLSAISGGQE